MAAKKSDTSAAAEKGRAAVRRWVQTTDSVPMECSVPTTAPLAESRSMAPVAGLVEVQRRHRRWQKSRAGPTAIGLNLMSQKRIEHGKESPPKRTNQSKRQRARHSGMPTSPTMQSGSGAMRTLRADSCLQFLGEELPTLSRAKTKGSEIGLIVFGKRMIDFAASSNYWRRFDKNLVVSQLVQESPA